MELAVEFDRNGENVERYQVQDYQLSSCSSPRFVNFFGAFSVKALTTIGSTSSPAQLHYSKMQHIRAFNSFTLDTLYGALAGKENKKEQETILCVVCIWISSFLALIKSNNVSTR